MPRDRKKEWELRKQRIATDPEYAEHIRQLKFNAYWKDVERRREKQRQYNYTSKGLPVPEKKVYKLNRTAPIVVKEVVEKVVEKPIVKVVEKVVEKPTKERRDYTAEKNMRLVVCAVGSAGEKKQPSPVIETPSEPVGAPPATFSWGAEAWA